MAGLLPDRSSLLRIEESDLSEASTAVDSASVQSNPYHRLSYQRMASNGSFDSQHTSIHSTLEVSTEARGDESTLRGLGIENGTSGRSMSSVSVTRVPVGAGRPSTRTSPVQPGSSKAFSTISLDAKNSPQTPGSARPLLSPAWARFDGGTSTYGYEGDRKLDTHEEHEEDQDISKERTSMFIENIRNTPPGYKGTQTSKTTTSSINDNDQYGKPRICSLS